MDHADAPATSDPARPRPAPTARRPSSATGVVIRYGADPGRRPTVLPGPPGRGAGPPRPERRRQDQHRRGARGLPAHRRRARSGCSGSTPGATTPRWCPASASCSRTVACTRCSGRPRSSTCSPPTTTIPRIRTPCSTWSGWTAPAGRRGGGLSGGEQQRLSLALALVGRAGGAVPGRADGRRRPRGPDRGARHHRRPARQGTVRAAHHPRARRGRAGGRPGGHRGPGPAPGRGDPGRAGLGHGRRLGPVLDRPRHRHRRPGHRHRARGVGHRGAPGGLPAATAGRAPRPRPSSSPWPGGWPSGDSRSATCAPASRWRRRTSPSPVPGPRRHRPTSTRPARAGVAAGGRGGAGRGGGP